ncbi:MAG: hypothetical protein RDU47_08530, partial [Spirochaetia bacterium]|nr:hypothetical protein [Spirochaetia bacterium]
VIGAPIMVCGREEAVFAIYRDIREKKQHELELHKETARLKSLVSILQHQSASVQEFLNFALAQAIELTNSKIGYIYHYSEENSTLPLIPGLVMSCRRAGFLPLLLNMTSAIPAFGVK